MKVHKDTWLLGLGLLLRLALVGYGEWQDARFRVKYTDVDYKVYTDAAQLVWEGKSPYERHTYRYTPLLAYLLVPNILLSAAFGKLLFVAADLIVTIVLAAILRRKGLPQKDCTFYSSLWLFHPFSVNISTRGNSDSLICMLVLVTIWLLFEKRTAAAGAIYGLAVHFRIYPVVYALSFYLVLDRHYEPSNIPGFFNKTRVTFTVSSAVTFLSLGVFFFWLYGFEFLYETYLYHFIRKDNRHNFSVYFYQLYLTYENESSRLAGILAFLPQAILLIIASVRLYKDVPFVCLITTMTFVIFNKYFLWYTSLLPLVLPFTRLSLKYRGMCMIVLWFATELHWLYWAYQLEFMGQNTFFMIWMAGILFFLANIWIMIELIRHHECQATFLNGQVARMTGVLKSD